MRTARIVLGVLIVVILAGDAAAVTQIDKSKYPSHWDNRIAGLVNFVEDTRHLRFKHPVKVEFLTDAEYRKKNQTSESELSAQDKKDLKTFEGQAHALGLISKDTDLLKQLNTLGSDATLAYYDGDAEKMVIKGTQLNVGLRVTIVHELTHALQDQSFGIDRDFKTDGAASFFDGLVEGDAVRVENEYVDSLNDADAKEYDSESNGDSGGEDPLAGIAPALANFFGAPYAFGEQITTLIVDVNGQRALDKLFRHPPASDEGLLNAFVALDGGQAVKHVATPKLRVGERKNDSGDFGSIAWYIVLTSFIDPKTALTAVDGWGGDSYVGYAKDGKPCIRVAFVGDTPTDTAEMTNALNQWKAAFTENTATVTPAGESVELDACEPNVVPKPRADAAEALILPTARVAFIAEVLPQASRALTECATKHFIAELPLDALTHPTQTTQQQLFAMGQRIGRGCASGQLT